MPMRKIIFFDTETTGINEEDRLVQIAYKIQDDSFMAMYKPPLPIPPGASAVHHITNEMVKDKNAFTESVDYQNIKDLFEDSLSVLVAHNMPFDYAMIQKEGITPSNTICTLRVARHLDRDGKLAKHNLQFLRYALGIEIEATAHDALGDVLVMEQLFYRLLKKIIEDEKISEEDAINKMVEISSHPSLLRNISFGKHAGKKVEEVLQTDRGYLEWLLAQKVQKPQGEDDWIYTLRHFLGK
jgi:DNA polymerase III epsilon subunit-like protein